jgi:hypothetical protein
MCHANGTKFTLGSTRHEILKEGEKHLNTPILPTLFYLNTRGYFYLYYPDGETKASNKKLAKGLVTI